ARLVGTCRPPTRRSARPRPRRSSSRASELPRLDVEHARAREAECVELVAQLDEASLRFLLPELILVLVDERDVLLGQLREVLLVVLRVDGLEVRELEVELLELVVHGG